MFTGNLIDLYIYQAPKHFKMKFKAKDDVKAEDDRCNFWQHNN